MTDMNILRTKGGDGIMEEIVEIFIWLFPRFLVYLCPLRCSVS
jgi:hypothetical protein